MAETCLTGQNLTATTDFKIGSNYVLFPQNNVGYIQDVVTC